jgi:DNA-binding beta-propeller fold protein YncE
VSDTKNNRVQKFTSNGTFITKWGSNGTKDGQFGVLLGIDIDSYGNVYTIDRANSLIQKFANNGTFIIKYTNPEFGNWELEDIELDSSDNVYVTDRVKNEIFKFVQSIYPNPSN